MTPATLKLALVFVVAACVDCYQLHGTFTKEIMCVSFVCCMCVYVLQEA